MGGTVNILGIPFDRLSMEEAVERIETLLHTGGAHLVVTPNPEMVWAALRDKELLQALLAADLRVPDGSGIIWASRVLGDPLPERVTGIDLMERLLRLSQRNRYRVMLLGSKPGVAEKAARRIKAGFPGINIVGVHHGYFAPEEERRVLDSIKRKRPDILFVGLGSPKQEKWMYRNLKALQVPLCMGVGGSLDVLAGAVRRAPLWMQNAGLEWVYRLFHQPRRIYRMMVLPKFAWAVLLAARRQRKRMGRRAGKTRIQ